MFWNAQGDECCCGPPPQCWAKYTVCPCSLKVPGIPAEAYDQCSGGSTPSPFIVGNAFLPSTNENVGPACWQLVSIEAELPPDSWIIVGGLPIESCDACCGCPDSSYCQNSCPPVGQWNIPAFTYLDDPCIVTIPASQFFGAGGCEYAACSPTLTYFFDCGSSSFTGPFKHRTQVVCNLIEGFWFAVFCAFGDGGCFSQICANYKGPPISEFSCGFGTYNRISGDSQLPPTITLTQ